ncbi:MAG TPA: chemotaxis protein CheW [Candidatus Methylomirabilis sp.]|nr:chemotaxis protein CheW [Candidatus Methylomirabilis sp.]
MKQAKPGFTSAPLGGTLVLMFLVAGKQFALDLGRVEQIIDYQLPTKTPRRPPFVEGVIEHRGRFLAVASLRRRLGVADATPTHPAILLLRGIGQDPLIGLVVDQVVRVMTLPPDGVLAPPPRVFGIRAEYIRGVANAGGRPVVWLDEAKLLSSAEPITLLA